MRIFLIAISFFVFSTTFASSPFSDINEWHINYEAVNELYKRWIIGWYSDWTFKPTKTLNRVESLKILLLWAWVKINDLPENSTSFSDTDKKAWYFKYISTAKNLWIVWGYPDWSFKPANAVNLAESLKMLIETNWVNYEKNISETPYFDISISTWFAWYFNYAKENDLFDWPNDWKINPSKDVTRAEFCEIIYRLIKILEAEKQNQSLASVYSDSDDWEKTESWEEYSKSKLTAGHRTFSFWTKLKVTNIKNWNSVIVTVNDRWPENVNRTIKLSHKAFNVISWADEKLLFVKIEEISSEDEIWKNINDISDSCNFPKNRWKIEEDFFTNIELNLEINKSFREWEIYNISWKVKNWSKNIIIFIKDSDWLKTSFYWQVWYDRFFSIDIDLWKAWEKQIWIIPWDWDSTYLIDIDVYEISCEKNYDEIFETKPKNLSYKIKDNETYLKWEWKWDLARIIFQQWNEKVVKYLNKEDEYFKVNPVWFKNFAEWEIFWQIALTSSSSDFSLDQNKWWSISNTKKSQIVKHHFSEIDLEVLEVFDLPNTYFFWWKIDFSWRIKDEVRTRADIILPDNNVESVDLISENQKIKNSNWVEIYPKLSRFDFSYKPKNHWTYILEINHVSWAAWINIPVYEEWFMPIIPDFNDIWSLSYSNNKTVEILDKNNFSSKMLSLINKDRIWSGLNRLILNWSLSQLAQDRANDMVKRDYFSHWTIEWKTANDLRFTYWIKTPVWENIAKTISVKTVHASFMRSAAHRKNILYKQWTRIWLWFAKSQDWNLIVVQLFSTSPILESDTDTMRSEVVDLINEKRDEYLVPNTTLHAVSQNWVDKMVNENFFDFDDSNWETLKNAISQAWINSTVSYFILAHSNWNGLLEEIKKNEGLTESQWKKIWVWIKQSDFWVINAVLIYTY